MALARGGIPPAAVTARVLCVNLGSRSAKISLVAVAPDAVAGRPAAPIAEAECPLDELADPAMLGPFESAGVDVVAYRVVRIRDLPAGAAAPFDAGDARGDRRFGRNLRRCTRAPSSRRSTRSSAPPDGARGTSRCSTRRSIARSPIAPPPTGCRTPILPPGGARSAFTGSAMRSRRRASPCCSGDPAPVRKLVGVHLGGGCSVAAIDGPRSIDTSMGFTPQDGLLMATRSGTLDAGMLLAYMRAKRLSIDAETEALISEASGLLGLGGSADMREIVARRAAGDERARLAYDVFVYRVVTGIGAMAAALGGVDAIAFLGGIGEHMPEVRADVCAGLAYLGARIDAERNSPATDRRADLGRGSTRRGHSPARAGGLDDGAGRRAMRPSRVPVSESPPRSRRAVRAASCARRTGHPAVPARW